MFGFGGTTQLDIRPRHTNRTVINSAIRSGRNPSLAGTISEPSERRDALIERDDADAHQRRSQRDPPATQIAAVVSQRARL